MVVAIVVANVTRFDNNLRWHACKDIVISFRSSRLECKDRLSTLNNCIGTLLAIFAGLNRTPVTP